MAADRVAAIEALLEMAKEAHGVYEETELNGVYDQDWPRWYATYAIDHGIGASIGQDVTIDRLAQFLASTNAEFEQAEPNASESWAFYTARRITVEV